MTNITDADRWEYLRSKIEAGYHVILWKLPETDTFFPGGYQARIVKDEENWYTPEDMTLDAAVNSCIEFDNRSKQRKEQFKKEQEETK